MKFDNDAEVKALKAGVRAAKYEAHIKKDADEMGISASIEATGDVDALAYLATRAEAFALDSYINIKAVREDAVSREALTDALIGMVETHLDTRPRGRGGRRR